MFPFLFSSLRQHLGSTCITHWFPFEYIMILFNLLLRHLTLCVRIKMKIYSWVVAHGSFCSKLFSNPSLFSYKQDVSWIKMQNKIQIESLLIHIYTNKRYSDCCQSMLTFYLSSTLMILGILQRVSDAKLPILEYYLSAKYARSWCSFTPLPIGN